MSDDQKQASLKHGECPICGSEHIRSGADVENKAGLRGGNRIPIAINNAVPLDNYVCIDCGYVESYIRDRAVLNRIEKQWQRVVPARKDSEA